jgi:hypothetical protein
VIVARHQRDPPEPEAKPGRVGALAGIEGFDERF